MTQKIAIWAPSQNLSGCIFATKARIYQQSAKSCEVAIPSPHVLMAKFSTLTADISSGVWGTITQLCRVISLQLRHVSTVGKNLLNSNSSPTCPHNMANSAYTSGWDRFGSLGDPCNSNGFRVLAALLHGKRASAKRCSVEQRAPPIFYRAAIAFGIGPHSSLMHCCTKSRRCNYARDRFHSF